MSTPTRKRSRLSLTELLELEGQAGLDRLAAKINANPKYLWQIASGPKTPSPTLAFRLVEADPRLDFVRLFESARPRPDSELPRVRRWST